VASVAYLSAAGDGMIPLPTPQELEAAWHTLEKASEWYGAEYPHAHEHWGALVEARRRVAVTMDVIWDITGDDEYHKAWLRVLELDDE
jgi:hypothetical protein